MTREQAREALCLNGHEDSDWVIAKVYNDHEAQLKELEEIISTITADLLHQSDKVGRLKAELKAKDEEIEILFGLIKSLWQIIDDIDTYWRYYKK